MKLSQLNKNRNMKFVIYLTLKNVPELAPLASKKRRWIHEQCIRFYILNAPPTSLGIIVYSASIFTTVVVWLTGETFLNSLKFEDSLLINLVLLIVSFVAGWFVFSRSVIPFLRPFYKSLIEQEKLNSIANRN